MGCRRWTGIIRPPLSLPHRCSGLNLTQRPLIRLHFTGCRTTKRIPLERLTVVLRRLKSVREVDYSVKVSQRIIKCIARWAELQSIYFTAKSDSLLSWQCPWSWLPARWIYLSDNYCYVGPNSVTAHNHSIVVETEYAWQKGCVLIISDDCQYFHYFTSYLANWRLLSCWLIDVNKFSTLV